jgi:hypothetical protein
MNDGKVMVLQIPAADMLSKMKPIFPKMYTSSTF